MLLWYKSWKTIKFSTFAEFLRFHSPAISRQHWKTWAPSVIALQDWGLLLIQWQSHRFLQRRSLTGSFNLTNYFRVQLLFRFVSLFPSFHLLSFFEFFGIFSFLLAHENFRSTVDSLFVSLFLQTFLPLLSVQLEYFHRTTSILHLNCIKTHMNILMNFEVEFCRTLK